MKNKYGRGSGNPHPVDIHVGSRLKYRRSECGYSQENLAELVGLTFQQVQKYERGANRISASRLWEFAEILDIEVQYFFEGYSNKKGHDEAQVPLPIWWSKLYFKLSPWQITAARQFINTLIKQQESEGQ